MEQDRGGVLSGEVVWAGGAEAAPEGTPGPGAPGGKRPRRPAVRFSAEAMRAVLKWVAVGEPLSGACARPGLPTHSTVNAWARSVRTFREALTLAREAGGWLSATHPGPRYCEATAQAIYARLCAGQSLRRICEDPAMPGKSTVYRWRGTRPEFAALLREARAVQAEDVAERGMEIADGVTPGTAYAVEVRLRQYRWTAGVMNPALFGRFRPVEHESVAAAAGKGKQRLDIRARHFEVKQDANGKWYLEELHTKAEQAVIDAGGPPPRGRGPMRDMHPEDIERAERARAEGG